MIWHSQGSGKSITQVFLSNAIAQLPGLGEARIVLITDRKDLDKQLGDTFKHCGVEVVTATTGAHLRKLILIHEKKAGVITTLIHKFRVAVQAEKLAVTRGQSDGVSLRDQSPDVFALVDESHRSEYGTLYADMLAVFPMLATLASPVRRLQNARRTLSHALGR